MITSVIELADALYKVPCDGHIYDGEFIGTVLSKVCSNANDIGLPLSVVQQLLKDTGYEKLI